MITQNGHWLALGGGAARWFFHLGVLKYLEASDIHISEISGTSMGAIIWAAFASWSSTDKIQKKLQEISFFKHFDLNTPFSWGFLKWDKILNTLKDFFSDMKFSDLKIPLKITATDISDWRQIIFSEWKVVDAVRASLSFPGAIAPHNVDGSLLLDGGLTNNLPVSILDAKDIIAVSALKKVKDYAIEDVNKKSIIKKAFLIRQQCIEEKDLEIARLQWKNIKLIQFDNVEFGYTDFGEFKKIVACGYNKWKDILEHKTILD